MESQNIIQVVSLVAEQKNLKVCLQESLKGACFAGFAALVGGILGGPTGIVAGGVLGSVVGGVRAKGKFKPLVTVISEMTPQEQKNLADAIENCFQNIDFNDVAKVMIILGTSCSLKDLLIKEVGKFLLDQMNMKLYY